MCGICGAAGIVRPDVLEDMAACLAHRGPDHDGTYHDDDAMLASQRLRVIDVDGGDQPISNEDGNVVVVYNGEIYNFRALRSELEAAGHDFATRSDTEVIVHGYEEWGSAVFGRLNGMFAVALWDRSERRLLLGRDRAGVKPLYFTERPEGVVFASEPKGILRSGLVEPAVDTAALQYFLQLRYSPLRTSLFEGIDAVPPGTYLDVRLVGGEWQASENSYWSLRVARDPPDDPVAAVRDALRRAVERQLVSDVPLGFYLSGGLDTSSVVAMAADLVDEPIHTFCMGFEEDRWDEREDARTVADHFDTVHHEIRIDGDFMQDFPRMIWHADEPKRNLYPYYVAEEMAEHVTVALGGLGADELFGGYVYRYNRLRELETMRSVESVTAKEAIRSTAARLIERQLEAGCLEDDRVLQEVAPLRHLDDAAELYVLLNSSDVIGEAEAYRRRAFGSALQGEVSPADCIRRHGPDLDDLALREQSMCWDFTVKLPNDFLLVEDRMSMAHSLESRVPFLDNDLIDLAFSLPIALKFHGGSDSVSGKAVLREAMQPLLPSAVFEKQKQGFTMPTFPFTRDELLPHAEAILNDPHVVRADLVSESYVQKLLDAPPNRGLLPHYKLLWKVVALEIWYQMYVVDGAEGPGPLERYYT